MQRLHNLLAGAVLALATVLAAGCESATFGLANRGLAPPDATAIYAPELGLALDVYRPHDAAAGPAPTVVFFYGGAWQRGERAQYQFIGRRLAQNGMLAIVADYRTWPAATFPGFVSDGARAIAWSHAHAGEYGGDPQQLFIAGHSAGAQIAGLLGTDPRHLGQVGLSLDQIDGVIGLSGPYDFAIGGPYRKIFGAPAQWPQTQAINYVDGDEPPFLLIHGADDRRVEARDSMLMAEKLRANHVPAQLLILPDTGHGAPLWRLHDPKRSPAVLSAVLEFVREPHGATALSGRGVATEDGASAD
jgi:acetyl esterase/lipase